MQSSFGPQDVAGCLPARKGHFFNGEEQEVIFHSKDGKTISLYDDDRWLIGETPCKIKIPRSMKYLHTVGEGRDNHIKLEKEVQWFPLVLNVLLWPTFFVDFGTGAAWKFHDVIDI